MITESCQDGTPEPAELLALAVRIAAGGAGLAQAKRREFITDVQTKSNLTDVVTAADHAVERYVIDALHEARPGDAIISEESGEVGPGDDRNGDAKPDVRWILDPIDGTVNYLYGVPHYGVSLAVEVAGEIVAGVVHNAATGEAWTAIRGGGAYRGGQRLRGSGATDLGLTLVATGFGYDPGRRLSQARVLAGLVGQIRDIRRLGAGAFDLCLAAEGVVDAYYERGLNIWDYSAGALIAAEAGLVVTGLDDDEAGYAFVLAAPAAIHGGLRDALRSLDAGSGP